MAITPDAAAMIEETAAGRMPFDDLQRVTFGDQEYDGDFHFAMFTPESFADILAEAGFADVEIVERGRRNGSATSSRSPLCARRRTPSSASDE